MADQVADEVLYAQRTGPWGWRVCWSLLGVLGLWGLLANTDRGLGFALASTVLYAGIFGIPVLVALLTLFSLDVYGAIVVTRSTLRVGRERVAVEDLSLPELLGHAGADDGARRRWAHLLTGSDAVVVPGAPDDGSIPMLGGAFGSRMGAWVLVLRIDGVGARRVDVQRPTEFVDALLRARTGSEPAAA